MELNPKYGVTLERYIEEQTYRPSEKNMSERSSWSRFELGYG
jgi:hypothetical protein